MGFGTTDVLIIDGGKIYKLILPTRGQQLAKSVRNHQGDIYVHGIEMGGNPLSAALKEKVRQGNRVYITEKAANTINYNFNKVKEKGFTIISDKEFESAEKSEDLVIYTADFIPGILNDFLQKQGIIPDFDFLGVAVQDHGKSDTSSTNFRGTWIQNRLEKSPTLDSFLFSERQIPSFLQRMNVFVTYLKEFYPTSGIYVMDTVFAAIQGAPYSQSTFPNVISMDIGNGHTAAVSQANEEIMGYFEFHTSAITPTKLEWAMKKLVEGNLSNDEIWKEGGHGALTRKSLITPYNTFITGPNRKLIEQTNLEYTFANPLGDMMITGCVGIALGIEKREGVRLLHPI